MIFQVRHATRVSWSGFLSTFKIISWHLCVQPGAYLPLMKTMPLLGPRSLRSPVCPHEGELYSFIWGTSRRGRGLVVLFFASAPPC
jgi:hypothetical protein